LQGESFYQKKADGAVGAVGFFHFPGFIYSVVNKIDDCDRFFLFKSAGLMEFS
jgi:hypothetical protein